MNTRNVYLETERLILRNLRGDDVEEIYDYRNNEKCFRYQRWEDTSREAVESLVRAYQNSQFLSLEEEQHYAICLKNNKIIGDLSYFYTEQDACITLGYTISYKYHRNGYAFEMLSALISEIKQKFPELEIVGLVEKENIPSINLLRKLGFIEECYAEQINSYVYTIPVGRN